jgi:hypothetical protein
MDVSEGSELKFFHHPRVLAQKCMQNRREKRCTCVCGGKNSKRVYRVGKRLCCAEMSKSFFLLMFFPVYLSAKMPSVYSFFSLFIRFKERIVWEREKRVYTFVCLRKRGRERGYAFFILRKLFRVAEKLSAFVKVNWHDTFISNDFDFTYLTFVWKIHLSSFWKL